MKNKAILTLVFILLGFSCAMLGENNRYYNNQDTRSNIENLQLSSPDDPVRQLWNRTWGGTNDEFLNDMVIDSSNNIYLAGWTKSYGLGDYDICLAKYDSSGTLLWDRVWGGNNDDAGYAVALDSSENIYVAGYTRSYGAQEHDMVLLKYSSSGSLLDNFTWGGSDWENAYDIILDSSENIYLAGYTRSFGAVFNDVCLVKFNSGGTLQWNRTWGGNDWECAYAIGLDSFEDVYLTGYTKSYGAIFSDAFLMKYNSTGTRQWNYTWDGSSDEIGYDLAIDSLNNIYVTGSTNTGWPDGDLFLLKYENITLPSLQWSRVWGGSTWDEGIAITLDSSDNIYIGGQTDSFGMGFPYTDFCLLVYDGAGIKQWNTTWGGLTDDACFAIGFDTSNDLYLAGPASSFGAGDIDMCVVKFALQTEITINSPNQNEFFGGMAPNFDISIFELNLNTTWYNLNGGANITFSGLTGTINQTIWNNIAEGPVTIRFYANDTMGNEGFSDVLIYKDTTAPTSSISHAFQGNNTVHTLTNFTLSADDGVGSGVSLIRYKINDSPWIDYSAPFTLAGYDSGDYIISYYSIDAVGNMEDPNEKLVDLISPTTTIIPGYNILFLLGIISVVSLILLRKRQ
jgi:uncharacterized delta-60 repeat protein